MGFDRRIACILLLAAPAGCASPSMGSMDRPSAMAKQSMGTRVASAFKSGASSIKNGATKAASVVAPPASADTGTQFIGSSKKKAGPDLYVSMAQIQERNGNFAEAERLYRDALKVAPNDLAAMVGYAHLHDRRGQFDQATKLYQRAIAKHPKEASAYNDLGLCFHRRGMLKEAEQTLRRATALRPDRKLYHNNLATVLVETGQTDAALAELIKADGEAVGHYNLGYLLIRRGNTELAARHFQIAASRDPSLTDAQRWVAKLGPAGVVPGTAPQMAGPGMPPTPAMHGQGQVAMQPPRYAAPQQPMMSPYAQAQAPSQAAADAYRRPVVRAIPVQYPMSNGPAPQYGQAPPAPEEASTYDPRASMAQPRQQPTNGGQAAPQ